MSDENQISIPESLQKWRDEGDFQSFEGNNYFVHASGNAAMDGEGVLIVHGFPGSSWDWHMVVEHLVNQMRVVVPDMLGYGQSDKPSDGNYSIFKSADMYEAVAHEDNLRNAVLVIHDLGQNLQRWTD